MSSVDPVLEQFSKHVPHILRKQLIAGLISEFGGSQCQLSCNPSIERFYAALLFVDISGFTVLSQKLSVDDLKTHINAYFKKMLDIVNYFEGDVIKFAGDALFIIWHATCGKNGLDEVEMQKSIGKAVQCGIEINLSCSNYKIDLHGSSPVGDSQMTSMLLTLDTKTRRTTRVAASKSEQAAVTYLNVHSGVSMGLMAGIDVGAYDRWEYLLLSTALTDVAVAEGDAKCGDLVVTQAAHAMFHPTLSKDELANAAPDTALSCGCTLTANRCFRVNQDLNRGLRRRTASNEGALALAAPTIDDTDNEEERMLQEVSNDEVVSFRVVAQTLQDIQEAFNRNIRKPVLEQYPLELAALCKPNESLNATAPVRRPVPLTLKTLFTAHINQLLLEEPMDYVYQRYVMWARHTLNDDLVRHVHEADREKHTFEASHRATLLIDILHHKRESALELAMLSSKVKRQSSTTEKLATAAALVTNIHSIALTAHDIHRSNHNLLGADAKDTPHTVSMSHSHSMSTDEHHTTAATAAPSSFVEHVRTSTRRSSLNTRHNITLQRDHNFAAELRNVIVVFIKINMKNSELFIDSDKNAPRSSPHNNIFQFLSRTERELQADLAILNDFQRCMEVVTSALHLRGGQLRQFIVDDKGTVCIGTFGLRGSVTNDDAAAAIESAHEIVINLSKIDLIAGIGVTSGKVYCGLVGSNTRHEYAVMGPSCNLSARLMGKAGPMEVLCDEKTRQRDRVHVFTSLGEVNAKGYSKPVQIYRPERQAAAVHSGSTDISPAKAPAITLKRLQSTNYMSAALLQNIPGSSTSQQAAPASAVPGTTLSAGGAAIPVLNASLSASTATTTEENLSLVSPDEKTFSKHVAANIDTAATTKCGCTLYGRQDECAQIFEFLLPFTITDVTLMMTLFMALKFTVHDSDLAQKLRALPPVFDYDKPVSHVCIFGPHGIGKTAVLSEFCTRMKHVTSTYPCFNGTILRTAGGSFHSEEPFHVWRSIVRRVIWLMYACSIAPGAASAAAAGGQSDPVAGTSTTALVDAAVEYTMSVLPTEYQRLTPLLGTIDVIRRCKDTEETGKLSGQARMNKTSDLISAILQAYVNRNKTLLLIVMDDIHTIDGFSMNLVKSVWQKNRGIAFFSSDLPIIDANGKCEVLDGFEALSQKEIEKGNTTPRFLSLPLQTLDQAATTSITKELFLQRGISDVHDGVYETIFSMCGGSPLYIHEICHVLIEKFLAMSSEMANTHDAAEDADIITELVTSFRPQRIEEVICDRFDKLDAFTQYVLKIASAVCEHSESFSIQLLAHMVKQSHHSAHNSPTALTDNEFSSPSGSAATTPHNATANAHHNSENNIYQVMRQLLIRKEFVTIHSMEGYDSKKSFNSNNYSEFLQTALRSSLDDEVTAAESMDVAHLTISDVTLDMMTFHFHVNVERQTIYDLMLDQQKQSLHFHIASYLDEMFLVENKPDSVVLYRHGLHYDNAKAYSNAMICFYRSAMVLDMQGAYHESRSHLTAAYRMLDMMYHDAGVSEEISERHPVVQQFFDNVNRSFQQKSTSMLKRQTGVKLHAIVLGSGGGSASMDKNDNTPLDGIKESGSSGGGGIPGAGSGSIKRLGGPSLSMSAKSRHELTNEDIARIFDGDANILEYGINTLVKLGQVSFTLGDDPVVTSKLFEDALKLMSLTWDNSQKASAGIIGSKSAPALPTAGSVAQEPQGITLRDISICFPILSGIAIQYRTGRLIDDDLHSKELGVCELFVKLAKTSEVHKAHLITGLYLMRNVYYDLGRITEAIRLMDEVMDIYVYEEHSTVINKHYATDRVPIILASSAQSLFMLGNIEKCRATIAFADNVLSKMSHYSSLGFGVIGVSGIKAIIGQNEEAVALFERYLEEETVRGVFSFFKESNTLYLEWLKLYAVYQRYLVSGGDSDRRDIAILAGHIHNNSEHATIIENIKNKQYLHQPVAKRPFPYLMQAMFSVGVEYMAAQVLYIHATLRKSELDAIVARAQHRLSIVEPAGDGPETTDTCVSLGKMQHKIEKVANDELQQKRKEISLLVGTAWEYVSYALQCTMRNNFCMFARCVALLLKADILVFMENNAEMFDHNMFLSDASSFLAEAHQALFQCVQFATKYNYQMLIFMVGRKVMELKLRSRDPNVPTGEALAAAARDAIEEAYGTAGSTLLAIPTAAWKAEQ